LVIKITDISRRSVHAADAKAKPTLFIIQEIILRDRKAAIGIAILIAPKY
jgi:hypothetical protein